MNGLQPRSNHPSPELHASITRTISRQLTWGTHYDTIKKTACISKETLLFSFERRFLRQQHKVLQNSLPVICMGMGFSYTGD